jgi:hypothetical protein
MEIIRHLSHEELSDLVIQSDQQALRPLLDALPELARTSAERPEQFWQEQRVAVWSRIARDRNPTIGRFVARSCWHGRRWRP